MDDALIELESLADDQMTEAQIAEAKVYRVESPPPPAQRSQRERELLEALEGCIEHMEWSTEPGKAACSAAHTTITKANAAPPAPKQAEHKAALEDIAAVLRQSPEWGADQLNEIVASSVAKGFSFQLEALKHSRIDCEAPCHMLLERPRCPLAELHATLGIHTVSDRNDRVEIIQLYFTGNSAAPFLLNYRGFLGSCRFDKLSLMKDVLQVETDVSLEVSSRSVICR